MIRGRTALICAISLLLALCFALPAFAATAAELDAHRNAAISARKQAEAADAAADKLAAEVARMDSEIDRLQREADSLDPQIAQATKRTAQLEAEVQKLRDECADIESDIAETTAEYERQQDMLAERVQSTYRQGAWYYLDILLGSQDFGDLITRTDYVGRVMEANSNAAKSLAATKDSLETAQVELERSLAAISAKRQEAASIEGKLRSLQNTRESKANAQEALQKNKSELMAETRENAARLLEIAKAEEAEAARVASELKGRGSGSGIYNGVMKWPVNGGYVSSPYGWRIHPIFKTKKFHRGIDIAASSGTAVYAAGDGTVIKASYGWGGGYGNRIWIDHGNGVITTYNHLKDGSFKVSSGQRVDKGDTIAGVGSTGYSTGAHLHFEIWVNGDTVNPMQYLQ